MSCVGRTYALLPFSIIQINRGIPFSEIPRMLHKDHMHTDPVLGAAREVVE